VAGQDYQKAIKMEKGEAEKRQPRVNQDKKRVTSTTLGKGVKILQILPWMPKVCYSGLFNRLCCMGLKLGIVVFSFELGGISIFRVCTNLRVASVRYGTTMWTAGYGSGLFNENEYFPHFNITPSSTRQIPPRW